MLFLYVLLFPLVATSVFASGRLGQQLEDLCGADTYLAPGYDSDDDLRVHISPNGDLNGFWSRNGMFIQVSNCLVYHCTEPKGITPPDCSRAFKYRYEYDAIIGGAVWRKWAGGRTVSDLL